MIDSVEDGLVATKRKGKVKLTEAFSCIAIEVEVISPFKFATLNNSRRDGH